MCEYPSLGEYILKSYVDGFDQINYLKKQCHTIFDDRKTKPNFKKKNIVIRLILNCMRGQSNMARPNKLFKKTMSYDNRKKRLKNTFNMQVSIADLIRTSVKLYIEDLRKEYERKERDKN